MCGKEDGRRAKNFRRAWRRVFEKPGLKPRRDGEFVWHSLRHEFVSQVAEHTDNPIEVMELARHQDIRTTSYMKAREERLKNVLRRKAKEA